MILATGGHAGNVGFRRMFDPRLTEEYQSVGEPWTTRNADSELLAMDIGASLWVTANQTSESVFALSKTQHIGCRWGYRVLKWSPDSPVFPLARASGLTVADFQNLILVNQVDRRFWNELDQSTMFHNACLGTNGNLGRDGKANGGGPIWAITGLHGHERRRYRDPNTAGVTAVQLDVGGETVCMHSKTPSCCSPGVRRSRSRM